MSRWCNRLFLYYTLLSVAEVLALSAFADDGGLKTYVAVDMVMERPVAGDQKEPSPLMVRGAELSLFGPIDHRFDGKLSFAAHPEGGESLAELHEATVSSSKIIPRSRFKIGQFFLGVGILNQVHQHDWSFISAPYVHKTVFRDSEGALDTGVEYSVLLPLPFYLDLTVGVTNGYTYGHSHSAGEKPEVPTHYVRAESYFSLFDLGFKPGVSYLSRTDASKNEMTLYGLDLVAKKRKGKMLQFLWLSELWSRTTKPDGVESEHTIGFHMYPQLGFSYHWYFGLRLDYYKNLSLENVAGDSLDNYRRSFVPTLTFQETEFAKFRLAFHHEQIKDPSRPADEDTVVQSVEFQTTFILGAHPAHDF